MPLYTGDKFGFGKAPDTGGGDTSAGESFFPEPGQYDWVCPAGVTSVCAVCIGGGGGSTKDEMGGSGGGGLGYKNNIAVTPGETYKIQVGAGGVGDVYMGRYGASGGDSWFVSATTVKGGGGGGTACGADGDHTLPGYGGRGGTYVGDGGGNGGNGGDGNRSSISGTGADTGGGGAGGYSGDGGKGGDYNGNWQSGSAGNGGAGGGGCTAAGTSNEYWGGGGGGVSVYGKGRSGSSGSSQNYQWAGGGYGGSGGASGWGNNSETNGYAQVNGGQYGGGGGSTDQHGGYGGSGAVRIIWGTGREFPSTGADDFWSETITRYTAPTATDPTTTSSNWFRGGLGNQTSYGSNYNYNGIVPNIQSHTDLTADLTVECWIYLERVVDNTQTFGDGSDGWGACIMDGRIPGYSSGSYLGSWWVSRGNSRRGSTGPYFLNYGATNSPSSTMTSDTECIQQSTWHHVALTRQNNVWWMWVDGVKVKASASTGSGGEGATAQTLTPFTDRPVLGGWGYGGRMRYWSWYGNISNFRITKDLALYDGSNSTFTVPTFPLTTTVPAGGNVEVLCCGVDDDFEKDLTGSRVWSGPNCMASVLGPGAPTAEVVKKGYRIWGRHRGLGGGTKTGNNGDPGDGGLLSTWKKSTGSFQTEQFSTGGGWSTSANTADGVAIKVHPQGAYASGDNTGAKWNLKSIGYGVPQYQTRNNSLGFGPFIPNVHIKVMAGKNTGDTVIYDSQSFTLRIPSFNAWNSQTKTEMYEYMTSCAFEIELPNGGANNLDMDTWYSVYIKGLAHPNGSGWNSTNGTPGANQQNFWYSESPVSYSSNSGSFNLMRYAPSTSEDTDDVEVRLEQANFNDTSWANNNHGSFNPLGQSPFFGISMPINFMKDPIPTSGGGGGGGGPTYTTSGLIFNVDASESSSYGGSGNTWTDIAGSNNVTLTNCTYSSANGGGINFLGNGNWSIGEFTTPFSASDYHTWEVWTNGEWTTGFPGSPYTWILHNSSQGQSTGSSYMTIGINDGNNFFGANDGKYSSMAYSGATSTNSTVYHLMFTWDGSTQKFYVNGTLANSQSLGAYSSWSNNASFNTTTTMGEAIGGNYRPLKGNIYSVRCWNRALSAAEVGSNFNGNKTKFGYASYDISSTGLMHYWNATSANVSGNTITDEVGSGNNLYGQWGNLSVGSTRGGEITVPQNTSDGWLSFGSDVTFGSGYSNQEFTFFWCGEKSQSPWWMLATGSDSNNFIGFSGSTLRIDSNQDTKGDLSYSSLSQNTLYCIYMTMASNGAMSWYVNGSNVGNNNYGGTWSSHNAIFDGLNHYDVSGNYQTAGKFYFAGFYSKALTSSEVSSNWTAHQTRLGI